jgi:hypothetical protein
VRLANNPIENHQRAWVCEFEKEELINASFDFAPLDPMLPFTRPKDPADAFIGIDSIPKFKERRSD